jgi:phosphoribosylanthranilate isomerase
MKMNPLKIKVCGMNNVQNLKQVDALKPDYLGFIFYPPSSRYVELSADAIPDTKTTRVAVFVNECIENMIKLTRDYRCRTIQLHGNESAEVCAEMRELGYEVFKAIKIDDNTAAAELEPYFGCCDAFLFDTKGKLAGGTGHKFNWKKLDELAHIGPFILGGGIDINDVDTIMRLNYPNLIGVDINSKFEVEPGLKNHEKVAQFIKMVRAFSMADAVH